MGYNNELNKARFLLPYISCIPIWSNVQLCSPLTAILAFCWKKIGKGSSTSYTEVPRAYQMLGMPLIAFSKILKKWQGLNFLVPRGLCR